MRNVDNQLVSIIVPGLHAEPYPCAMPRQHLAQTHRELEVICLNDGSTDGSLAICRHTPLATSASASSTSRTKATEPPESRTGRGARRMDLHRRARRLDRTRHVCRHARFRSNLQRSRRHRENPRTGASGCPTPPEQTQAELQLPPSHQAALPSRSSSATRRICSRTIRPYGRPSTAKDSLKSTVSASASIRERDGPTTRF